MYLVDQWQARIETEKREPLRKLWTAQLKQEPITETQSIIMARDKFATAGDASEWARAHDFTADKVVATETSYRIRQRDTRDFVSTSFRTVKLGDGVTAVVGRLKPDRVAKEAEPGLTAIRRDSLSKPMARLKRDGLLKGNSVFDYGMGLGDDVKRLRAMGIKADGWDPNHAPKNARKPADVVNMGYVVNVIESPTERKKAIASAWGLARKLLVVTARTKADQPADPGKKSGDGFLTSRNTFQKFFENDELVALVSRITGRKAELAESGVVYAFKSDKAREELKKAAPVTRDYLERALKLARKALPGWAYSAIVAQARGHAGGKARARLRAEERLAMEKAAPRDLSDADLRAAHKRLGTLLRAMRRRKQGTDRVERLHARVEREMVKRKMIKAPTEKAAEPTEAPVAKGFHSGEPDGGVHAHGLNRQAGKTQVDGAHVHLFAFPGTTELAVSAEDGAHEHGIAGPAQTANDGAHSHKVRLPTGEIVETSISGRHRHGLMVETSSLDAPHRHELTLPDGTVVESLDVEGYLERYPDAASKPQAVPSARAVTMAIFRALHPPPPPPVEDGSIFLGGELPTAEQALALAAKGDDVVPVFQAVAEVMSVGEAIELTFGGEGAVAHATAPADLEMEPGDLVVVELNGEAASVVGHSEDSEPTDSDEVAKGLALVAELRKTAPIDFAGPELARVVFVCGSPNELETLRRAPLVGSDGAAFAARYLEPLGLTKADVGVGFAVPSLFGRDLDWSRRLRAQLARWPEAKVVAVGKEARAALGELADVSLPHPRAVRKGRNFDEIDRKLRRVRKWTTSDQAYYWFGTIDQSAAVVQDDPTGGTGPSTGTTTGILAERLSGILTGAVEVSIAKSVDEKQIVFGVVLDPYQVDLQEDWIPPAEIEATAHDFLTKSRIIGLNHEGRADAEIVESFVELYPTPADREAALQNLPHTVSRRPFGGDVINSGAWVAGVKLSDELWAAHKRGELDAFSIGGFSFKSPVTTAAMPEVTFVDLRAE